MGGERAWTVAELAEALDGTVEGERDRRLHGLRPLAEAGPRDLSFLSNPRYAAQAERSRAGAVLVGPQATLAGRTLIRVSDPYYAFSRAIRLLCRLPAIPRPGVHPTAVVEPGARLGAGVHVGARAVVGAGASLGDRVCLYPGVVIGDGVVIGADCVLYYNVSVYPGSRIGQRVVLQAGVVVGSDGFGFATHAGVHHKILHAGGVVIGDDVELGANVCVDRGALGDTTIGRGTKIDNLVQIGHNVDIGESCLLVAQSGVSGSSRLDDGTVLGGQSGVVGHVAVGAGVRIAARCVVTKDVAPHSRVAGFPAQSMVRWRRVQASLQRLPELLRRVARLERDGGDGAKGDAGT